MPAVFSFHEGNTLPFDGIGDYASRSARLDRSLIRLEYLIDIITIMNEDRLKSECNEFSLKISQAHDLMNTSI